MAAIVLDDIVRSYGDHLAVDHVSLTVDDGAFVALVGPSGCGKTTTLNLVAGLIELTSGEIRIGDRNVSDLDPKDRDVAMVFQNYALYPQKTVAKNLAFPLQMRRVPRADIERRVGEAARALDITHLLQRRPRELSGGQQQRVALGRALVRDPKAFLMDEPLSNLDAKLRVQTRAELKRFHQDLGATIVYVTHDQLEAMTMADKMAVMEGGRLQQYDRPERVYDAPANVFVAGFVGSPAMNLLPVTSADDMLHGPDGWRMAIASAPGQLVMGARHNAITLTHEARPGAMPGRVYTVEPTGDVTYIHVRTGAGTVIVSAPPHERFAPDESVFLGFDPGRVHLFDAGTGLRRQGESK